MKTFYFPASALLPGILACGAVVPGIEERDHAAMAEAGVGVTADTPWIVSSQEPESVRSALEDVQGDWYKVLGHVPVVLTEPPKSWPGPVVYLGLKGPWLKDLVQKISLFPSQSLVSGSDGHAL